ncbi:hypothetical protein [Campylobacter suis]|uniref:Plasmid mobilization relaxosome protein MobC n=1 Tax=Campylobacter suis TaxID=2790657 RepID=A0ABN7K7M6_9BACT|nr:hypothetical protein [Campylobacter suis]CAD7286885.1 hypothetical protein LMG8286_00589 [Campylobacter suis]
MKKNNKDCELKIRITSELKQKLYNQSSQVNMTMSEAVTYLIENGEIRIVESNNIDPIIVSNLARTFSNINQIAKAVNIAQKQGNISLNDIQNTQEALYKNERLLAGIIKYLKESNDNSDN